MEVPLIFQMKPFSISRFREISLPFIPDKTEAGSVLEPFRVMEMVSFSLEALIRSLTASQPFLWKLPQYKVHRHQVFEVFCILMFAPLTGVSYDSVSFCSWFCSDNTVVIVMAVCRNRGAIIDGSLAVVTIGISAVTVGSTGWRGVVASHGIFVHIPF